MAVMNGCHRLMESVRTAPPQIGGIIMVAVSKRVMPLILDFLNSTLPQICEKDHSWTTTAVCNGFPVVEPILREHFATLSNIVIVTGSVVACAKYLSHA